MYTTIKYERRDDNIGIAYINRPDVLNALNEGVLTDMEKLMEEIENDKALRVLILSGTGRAFVAGADIATQHDFGSMEGRAWGKRGCEMLRKIRELPIPTIAAVNGFALGGGCEMAMSCDIILAARSAKFGMPEVSLGICPGFSGTQLLPRLVGTAKAKEMIFTGRMLTAVEAEGIGLVNAVYPQEDLMDAAIEMAALISKKAPIAVRLAKTAVDHGMRVDLESGIGLENELFGMCFSTEDQKEGMSAFLEKRSSHFHNR